MDWHKKLYRKSILREIQKFCKRQMIKGGNIEVSKIFVNYLKDIVKINVKMNPNANEVGDRFQHILKSLSKCKIEFTNEKEECEKLREINSKLELELKETRELEKSHRYHLTTSREMIGNLQETVSQLVYLKRDVKKLKEEIAAKNAVISAADTDKEILIKKQDDVVKELRNCLEKQMEEMRTVYERKIQEVQHDSDTQIAQYTCVIEELRSKINDMVTEHKDKINVVVLEYEEKIQRGVAQVTQLQDQLVSQTARTDANINAYRRRLEELEEKLKQSQFKQYLAQSSDSQYESQVERPYFVPREIPGLLHADSCSVDLDPVLEYSKPKPLTQSRVTKAPNTLQVMYYGNKTTNMPSNTEKKGQFHITKKRKLYSDNLQNF